MSRIYTRSGDKGETGLVGGTRVPKDSIRVQAYGDIDELNSILGIAKACMKEGELYSLLEDLQRDLFIAGADLAASTPAGHKVPNITQEKVEALERMIDKCQLELPPLKAFILPGGSQTGAILHFSRTVARRAERAIVTLSRSESINAQMIPYFNRLSDLLFVIARLANRRDGRNEIVWHHN